ncbi:MAG: HlyD family efflux transporter periplasmic adaptor subunit [Deltaproteobacteria bacterium]|nr:HlyD family efflux transporter periplasmic adaptor subunit [Deltaproteobacteria bacterium]
MNKPLRWTLGILTVGAVAAAVSWGVLEAYGAKAGEEPAESAAPPAAVGRAGTAVEVTLTPEAIKRSGVKTEPLAAATLEPEVVAYGRLEEDPSRSFTLRAPLAGILRASPVAPWPSPGSTLSDGAVVGSVEPRYAPAERVDLSSRLVAARSEKQAVSAEVATARAALERARTLHAEDRTVSDRALQEAELAVDTARARLRQAEETIRLLEAALVAGSADAGVLPLAVERGGEVVEALAQPGEAVESGQPILRVVRFDRLVARIDVPAGELLAEPVAAAGVFLLGDEDRVLGAETIGPAPSFDPDIPGRTILFRVGVEGTALRPGAAVGARLRSTGAALTGVVVPRSAVIRTSGRAWVWVDRAPRFVRREVPLDRPTASGWFAGAGFAAGERVVVVGAQDLLSAEMMAGGGGEEE